MFFNIKVQLVVVNGEGGGGKRLIISVVKEAIELRKRLANKSEKF